MECKEIVDLLNEYIDRELAESERRIVEAHLKACPDCRAQLATIKSTVSMVEGLGELEVPAGLSHALRQIAKGSPGMAASKAPERTQPAPAKRTAKKRGIALPKAQYLLATAAVAAVALIALLTQIDFGGLGKDVTVNEAARKSAVPAGGQQSTKDVAPDGASKNNDLLMRGLPDSNSNTWPEVVTSSKTYNDDSAHKLLDDIQKKTDGLYTVKDARAKRVAVMNTLVERINASGGKGGLLRSPISSLLDETKRAALPVYLERAKFNKQTCMLVIIKWGFGGDKNSLYKTSLYVTDPSGWSIIYYESK